MRSRGYVTCLNNETNKIMDRHQFVEKMIALRNEKNLELEDANKRKNKAYNRSATKINEILKPKEITEGVCNVSFGSLSGNDVWTVPVESLKEDAKVTDLAIVALCGDIRDIENQIKEVDKKTEALKKEDVISAIEEELKD